MESSCCALPSPPVAAAATLISACCNLKSYSFLDEGQFEEASSPVFGLPRIGRSNSRWCCPAGHLLEPWVACEEYCDTCGRPVPQGHRVVVCRECDWCLCSVCHPQERAEDSHPRKFPYTCPRGHELQPRRALRGACNGCKKAVSEHEHVMDCRECNWYLCTECHPQDYHIATTLGSMTKQLFTLHDLNGNSVLEETELVRLNTRVAKLHYGKNADIRAVKAKYAALYQEKFDHHCRPVAFPVFRTYMKEVLYNLDPDPLGQEMILEQIIAEAQLARAVFHKTPFASASTFRSDGSVSWDIVQEGL